MRALVVLLVIINIAFAAWQITREQTPASRLPPADSGVEPLRLLSEIPAPAITPPPAPASQPPSPPPAAPADAAPDAEATAEPAEPARTACYSLGPFADAGQAEQAAERLRQGGIVSRQRTTESQTSIGYRVVLPPLPSRESALQVGRQLGAEGITDYQVIVDEAQRNVVSLGVFKDQEAAARRQAQVAALGYAPRIEARTAPATQYWLDTEAVPETPEQVEPWAALQADFPAARRQTRTCE